MPGGGARASALTRGNRLAQQPISTNATGETQGEQPSADWSPAAFHLSPTHALQRRQSETFDAMFWSLQLPRSSAALNVKFRGRRLVCAAPQCESIGLQRALNRAVRRVRGSDQQAAYWQRMGDWDTGGLQHEVSQFSDVPGVSLRRARGGPGAPA